MNGLNKCRFQKYYCSRQSLRRIEKESGGETTYQRIYDTMKRQVGLPCVMNPKPPRQIVIVGEEEIARGEEQLRIPKQFWHEINRLGRSCHRARCRCLLCPVHFCSNFTLCHGLLLCTSVSGG